MNSNLRKWKYINKKKIPKWRWNKLFIARFKSSRIHWTWECSIFSVPDHLENRTRRRKCKQSSHPTLHCVGKTPFVDRRREETEVDRNGERGTSPHMTSHLYTLKSPKQYFHCYFWISVLFYFLRLLVRDFQENLVYNVRNIFLEVSKKFQC